MRRAGRTSVTWSTTRVILTAALVLFGFTWFFVFIDSGSFSSWSLLRAEEENLVIENLNLPPLKGLSSSLSGSHIISLDNLNDQYDLDASSVTAEIEFQAPPEHPKVALMFLVKRMVPTEPVWRQFLENAGKLKLKAKGFKFRASNLKERLHHPLFPTITSLDESRYPGYKIQHGLVPPSKYRSTDYPHIKRRRLQRLEESIVENVARSGQIASISRRPVDGWVNASNAGCRGEENILRNYSTMLLHDERFGHEIYEKQDLFSLYVHTSPGFLFPRSSLFAGSEIPDPVNLTNAFALHTLVLAELKLLEAALLDERNQKFVLLSESCIPIHPPEVVYAQVLHESKSRINACLDKFDYGRLELWRWKTKMATSYLQKEHWRKSQQWFILSRDHAELAVKDQHVKEVFKRYCWSYGKHICVSDEHFLPTLLSSYGLDDQTDCLGEGTWTNWTEMGWHPKTFMPEEISPKLLRITMNRGWPPCDPLSARKTALRLFELQDDLPDVDLDDDCMEARLDIFPPEWAVEQSADNPDDWIMQNGYVPLGYECPIFARKFPSNATAETLNATLSCSGAALGPWCLKWHQFRS